MTKVTHIVVHYSATYADQDLTVKDIDKMHRERGWQMVGYHYVIRRDGTIERGRPESMVGAHVGNQNTGKIGICCIGGLERATGPNKGVDNRTPQQVESLIKLIRDILKRHPGAQVVGHRDLAPTQCPGFDVPAWWAKVQKKAAPEPKPASPTAPAKTGYMGEQKRHVVAKGETWWSISQMYGLGVGDLARANGASPTDTLVVGRELSLVIPAVVVEKKVDKPVVPSSVDQEVKRQTNGASWFTSLVTGGAAGASAIFGAEWTTVLAIGGIGLILLALLILFRHRILAAINEFRAGLA